MATHSFPVPNHLISIVIFSLKNVKEGQEPITRPSDGLLARSQTKGDIYILAGSCIWSALNKYQNGTAKVAKKAFNLGRSGTQYVAMVTELLCLYRRAYLVESCCKVSNISDTNWLRYLFSSYLNKIWLSV